MLATKKVAQQDVQSIQYGVTPDKDMTILKSRICHLSNFLY